MVVVLIPSYKPDEGLLTLLADLIAQDKYAGILVVDDGSGEAYQSYFDRAEKMPGVVVVHHSVNLGKGRGIKTGINAILRQWPQAHVLTADADGQHTPQDIAHIADELEQSDGNTLVLGMRRLGKGTPFKSKWGNAITRWVFLLATGKKVYDTQTGLRGLANPLLAEMMTINGERYEYEMNVLLNAPRASWQFHEVEIETVYHDNNSGSHFNPIRDALMVFTRVIAFALSSLMCFAVDYCLYAMLMEIAHLQPEFAYVGARIVSSLLNFVVNRNWVFRADNGSLTKQVVGYYALVILVMILGTTGVKIGTDYFMGNGYLVKIIVDTLLWFVSFLGQRLLVFKPGKAVQKA